MEMRCCRCGLNLDVQQGARAARQSGAHYQRHQWKNRPALTGTRWDALLAATAEHICELHGHPVQSWMDEPARFLNKTWVLAWTPSIWSNALAFAPPAFVRHGAVPDPRELDERGGERREWVPE